MKNKQIIQNKQAPMTMQRDNSAQFSQQRANKVFKIMIRIERAQKKGFGWFKKIIGDGCPLTTMPMVVSLK